MTAPSSTSARVERALDAAVQHHFEALHATGLSAPFGLIGETSRRIVRDQLRGVVTAVTAALQRTPMRWSPVLGNCNDAWQVGADPLEYVRCTGVDQHEGLHRCHFRPPGVMDGPRTAMVMWGDDDASVSIDVLRDVLNPLGLIPNVAVRTIPLGPEAGRR